MLRFDFLSMKIFLFDDEAKFLEEFDKSPLVNIWYEVTHG